MMNTIHHRIGVFPIEVRPAFWVLCLVFGLMDLDSGATVFQALFLAPVLYLSVLTHEMGHALAARSMGQTVYSISLHGMGGTTVHTRPKSGTVRTLISIAGPAFGFGLAFVLGVAALNTPPEAASFLARCAYLNVFWSALNLLPILPLDGGQALVGFLCALGLADTTANVLIGAAGWILSAVGMCYALLVLGSPILAAVAGYFAMGSYREFALARRQKQNR